MCPIIFFVVGKLPFWFAQTYVFYSGAIQRSNMKRDDFIYILKSRDQLQMQFSDCTRRESNPLYWGMHIVSKYRFENGMFHTGKLAHFYLAILCVEMHGLVMHVSKLHQKLPLLYQLLCDNMGLRWDFHVDQEQESGCWLQRICLSHICGVNHTGFEPPTLIEPYMI